MAQKQGGKGKSSSPSDIRYWQRVKPETQKAARIARHAKRMGLNKTQLAASQVLQTIPRPRLPRIIPSVVFSSPVANQAGRFLQVLEVAGVLVEISPHSADIDTAIRETFSRLPYRHYRLNPLSGEKTLIASRKAN